MAASRNPFDDLIPQNANSQTASSDANPFADLIPTNNATTQQPLNLMDKIKQAAPIVGSDILSLPGKAARAGINALNAAPSEIPGATSQIFNDPNRALNNVMIGGGGIEQGLVNLPSDIANYGAHLGLITPQQAAKVPSQSQNIIQQILQPQMGQSKAGDTLLQLAPMVYGGEGLLPEKATNIAKGTAALPFKVVGNIAKNVKTAAKDLSPYEKAASDALNKLEGSNAILQQTKDAAKEATGISNPSSMINKVNNAQAGLAATPEDVGAAISPDAANINESLNQQNVSNIEGQINQHLNQGAGHEMRIGEGINSAINNIENHYSDSYKTLMKNLDDAHFQMPEPVLNNYDVDQQKLLEAVRSGKGTSFKSISAEPDVSDELKNILNKAPTSKDTTASDFMAKYKDFRDARYDASQRMKSEPSASKRQEIVQALNDSKPMEDTIKTALSNGLGQYQPEFERINKGYSTLVFPLRGYRVARGVRNTGKLKNAMSALSGNSAYPRTAMAQQALRNIVKNDPDLLRNVVGQKFAGKPEKLHTANETAQEYINQMPELQNMLSQHKAATEKLEAAKNITKTAEQTQKTLSEREKLQNDIDKYAKEIPRLQKAAADKKISLAEKIKTENELQRQRALQGKARAKILALPVIRSAAKLVSKI